MRIYILGPSGSGKSYLASRLSKFYQIPHIEIDKIWTEYGGPKLYRSKPAQLTAEKDELRENVLREISRLADEDSWVIDGNYSYIRDILLGRADSVIFIKPSRHESGVNLLRRQLRGENRKRGYGLRDFIWHFRKANKSHDRLNKKLADITKSLPQLVVLRTKPEVERYIKYIETTK